MSKTIVSQIEKYLIDDRVYPTFKPMGAETGRISCVEPNVMGLPRTDRCVKINKSQRPRNLVVARKGYKLVVADYSQQELRIAGKMFPVTDFITAFLNDEDLHVKTGAFVIGETVEIEQYELKQNANKYNL